jgi:hypothetical protein
MSEATKMFEMPWTDWPVGAIIGERLPASDGEPLGTCWEVRTTALLNDLLLTHFRERQDFYFGANMPTPKNDASRRKRNTPTPKNDVSRQKKKTRD